MDKIKHSSFVRFFTKLPQLLLGGILFSVPLAVFLGIFVLIGRLTGLNNIFLLAIWSLAIIPVMPFYAGLVMVVRKYSVEKEDANVFHVFFESVKENFKAFLFHGFILYLITVCAFFAVIYYYSLAQTDIVFGSVLTLYLIFIILLIATMCYVPLISVTYELRYRDVYKNSFLLVFGKILRSLAAMVLLAVVSFAAFLALLFTFDKGVWFAVVIALVLLLYPLLSCYIVNSVLAKGVQETVGYFTGKNAQPLAVAPGSGADSAEQEVKALENADSSSDYVFVNGKMIKNPDKKPTDSDRGSSI